MKVTSITEPILLSIHSDVFRESNNRSSNSTEELNLTSLVCEMAKQLGQRKLKLIF